MLCFGIYWQLGQQHRHHAIFCTGTSNFGLGTGALAVLVVPFWLLVISAFSAAISFPLVWRNTGEKWQITLRGIICERVSDTLWEHKEISW